MVRIPSNIDTVKIYKRPVSIIEDIFDLEIVIGLVDVNQFLFSKRKHWKER